MRLTTIMTVMNNVDNLIMHGVPVTSTVIELNKNYLMIIDTGMPGGSDLLDQLDDKGYSPADFKLVINTHLHPDHIGGNRYFPNARIIISKRELIHQKKIENKYKSYNSNIDNQYPNTEMNLSGEMKKMFSQFPVKGLVGDKEQIEYFDNNPDLPDNISYLDVPGHTCDHKAIIVQNKYDAILVAGDALFHRDINDFTLIPHLNFSEKMFLESEKKILNFSGFIIPGHDRAFNNQTRDYKLFDEYVMQ